MARRSGWFAKVLGFYDAQADADRGYASYEHVDGSLLAAGEFHLSDSMRFDESPMADFSETLPSYSALARSLPPRIARAALNTRH